MDEGSHTPTVPIGLDIAWFAFMILWIILTVVACVSIARSDVDRVGKLDGVSSLFFFRSLAPWRGSSQVGVDRNIRWSCNPAGSRP